MAVSPASFPGSPWSAVPPGIRSMRYPLQQIAWDKPCCRVRIAGSHAWRGAARAADISGSAWAYRCMKRMTCGSRSGGQAPEQPGERTVLTLWSLRWPGRQTSSRRALQPKVRRALLLAPTGIGPSVVAKRSHGIMMTARWVPRARDWRRAPETHWCSLSRGRWSLLSKVTAVSLRP